MTLEEARKAFEELELRLFAYNHASAMIYYDGVTAAPRDTSGPRGKTLAVLSEAEYGIASGEEMERVLETFEAHKDGLTPREKRSLELKRKAMRQLRCIPVEEYVAFTELVNEAENVWHKAKEASDYPMFEPYLARIVAANRRFASLVEPDMPAYDYCLDTFEEGLTMERCDAFFNALKERMIPLMRRVLEKEKPASDFLHVSFPADKQKQLSEYLMGVMGIDPGHCALGVTEHPFTIEFSKYDVRITTHYHENDFLSAMYSTVHEGGHALYELHTGDELAYLELGTGVSMAVHESQSRFYENILGRSREYIGYIYPKLVELCPELGAHSPEELYRAANIAEPSLIRTEADELTYYLHIIVRYELEKGLISGEISTKELPERWNALYKQYLGVDVPDDKRGVLQDSHWSGGSFGYFPSYALGSAYGAQLLEKMKETVDVSACLSRGDFAPINKWLEERIWRFGSMIKPGILIENAMEAPFDPKYYMDYLEAKVSEIYGL